MSPAVAAEQTIDISPEEQTRLAEIERDNLDIVKQCRANPDLVEYEAYSHSSASEKEHSLTASVSCL
jgi:hypothetical protein